MKRLMFVVLAGVAALNGCNGVSRDEEGRMKVDELLSQNRHAGVLLEKETGQVYLLVSNPDPNQVWIFPVGIQGVEDILADNGYSIILPDSMFGPWGWVRVSGRHELQLPEPPIELTEKLEEFQEVIDGADEVFLKWTMVVSRNSPLHGRSFEIRSGDTELDFMVLTEDDYSSLEDYFFALLLENGFRPLNEVMNPSDSRFYMFIWMKTPVLI